MSAIDASETNSSSGKRCCRKQSYRRHCIERTSPCETRYAGQDPKAVNFVDLRNWVLALPGFEDDPKRSGEKILEAIQMAWIDEAE